MRDKQKYKKYQDHWNKRQKQNYKVTGPPQINHSSDKSPTTEKDLNKQTEK